MKQFPTLGREMSVLRLKICSLVIKSALLSSDGQLEEKFWKFFYFFWFFFVRPGNIFWFFSCIIPGMVVQTKIHQPRGTYPLRKNLWENCLSFPDYECNFLNFHWCLLFMLSKLQFTCSKEPFEKVYFFRILLKCFQTLSNNRPDLWQETSAALPKLHSTRPDNFSLLFASFCHVLFTFVFERKELSSAKKN